MSSTDLDALLARMPEISEAVEKFSFESIQSQVLQALLRAFDAGSMKDVGGRVAHGGSNDALDINNDNGAKSRDVKKSNSKRSDSGKSKQSFTIDKNLDLVNNSPSFKVFVDDKVPRTNPEKCLVSVYWLTRCQENARPATIEQVYSCYKHMEWPVPSDLANMLSQAGTKGWLDSRDRENLRVVVAGENYLEHEMPAKNMAPDK